MPRRSRKRSSLSIAHYVWSQRGPTRRSGPNRSRVLDGQRMYCHCEYMTPMKGDRLQLRVDAAAKRRLEEAATGAHLSVTAFVLQAASRAADDVLAERQTIHLSPDAAAAFTEALNRPAQVNERLAKALQRPTKFTWLD